jgi:hypothetical protein
VVGTAPDLAFRYISVAEVINEIMGTNLAGVFVGETSPAAHRDFLRGLFREVVSTGRPVYSASGFTYAPNGSATPVPGLSTERLFLPLSHGGDAVAEILCGQTFDWAKRDTTVSYVLRSAADRADFVGRFGE